jgi:hypothetical protein
MFGRRMKALGLGSEKIAGNKVYVGLEIADQDC